MIKWADKNRADVVIQNRGRAEVVLIPFSDYELLQKAREELRKRRAIEGLRQIAREVGARNQHLSDAEVQELAREMTRETVENLVRQGKVTFEEEIAE